MNWYMASIRQHDTHSDLAKQGEPGSPPTDAVGLDAIIVPATRPAAYLDHAVTLARAAQCSLVILCSQHLHGVDVKEYLAARSFNDAIVIDLPAEYSHPLFDFGRLRDIKDQLPPECGYLIDLSMKRNVGLVLARMLGWQRVFFLDDDIRDITCPDLQRTVDMLGSFSAVGMRVTDFPDNSIVCHANRITGGAQDVFVSGAALAVDCDSDIGFFPGIYNEDWFFFFDAASRGQLGNSDLKATQLVYYPFAKAERAGWQEFGDVLAEGLYSLLHLHMDVEQATNVYWAFFLEERRRFLEDTLSRVAEAPLDMRDEIIASINSALKCLSRITPDLCARYVEAWRHDLEAWKLRWAEVRVMTSVAAALEELRLPTPAETTKRLLHPQDRPPLHSVPGPVAIPQFETLRKMADRHSTQRLTLHAPDERPSTEPSAISHEHGRRHRRSRTVSAVQRSALISTVLISAIYCQIVAMRIFSVRKISTPPVAVRRTEPHRTVTAGYAKQSDDLIATAVTDDAEVLGGAPDTGLLIRGGLVPGQRRPVLLLRRGGQPQDRHGGRVQATGVRSVRRSRASCQRRVRGSPSRRTLWAPRSRAGLA
jgi:hypothetical protein